MLLSSAGRSKAQADLEQVMVADPVENPLLEDLSLFPRLQPVHVREDHHHRHTLLAARLNREKKKYYTCQRLPNRSIFIQSQREMYKYTAINLLLEVRLVSNT